MGNVYSIFNDAPEPLLPVEPAEIDDVDERCDCGERGTDLEEPIAP